MTNRQFIESRHRLSKPLAARCSRRFRSTWRACLSSPDYIRGGWEWMSDAKVIYVAGRHLRVVSTVTLSAASRMS
jgi:hypothetical protein